VQVKAPVCTYLEGIITLFLPDNSIFTPCSPVRELIHSSTEKMQVRRDLSYTMPSVSSRFGKQSMFYGFYFLSRTIVLIEGRKNCSDKQQ